jgi:hypothetical protein
MLSQLISTYSQHLNIGSKVYDSIRGEEEYQMLETSLVNISRYGVKTELSVNNKSVAYWKIDTVR